MISPQSIVSWEYDYILCASDYENEMRRTLKELHIPDEKIISGKLNYENIMEHKYLFDISHFLAYQNQTIEKSWNFSLAINCLWKGIVFAT